MKVRKFQEYFKNILIKKNEFGGLSLLDIETY